MSITRHDLSTAGLLRKAPSWWAVFSPLRDLTELGVTENRLDSLAEKRREKRNKVKAELPPLTSQFPTVWKGERSVLPPKETARVTSISDPAKGSADSKVYYACQEKDSDRLGNQFCSTAIELLFDQNPPLTWATGRRKPPVLQWVCRYHIQCRRFLLNSSSMSAEIKLGDKRFGARTDGGLQISLQHPSLITWERSYYEIALEATSPFFPVLMGGKTVFQSQD